MTTHVKLKKRTIKQTSKQAQKTITTTTKAMLEFSLHYILLFTPYMKTNTSG